jgi:hypothetical protein
MNRARIAACAIVILGWATALRGQTAEGDILRGQGVFLEGAGLYRLYSAEGRSIDADTLIKLDRWNREVFAGYLRARAARMARERSVTNAAAGRARAEAREREDRHRTAATDDDIVSGDALNTLLLDLSDPSIPAASWASAAVPLPAGLSIGSLFFRFAPPLGKEASVLGTNLIALGRLDPARGWPAYLPPEAVGRECRAYEAAYRVVLEQCRKGALTLESVLDLDRALAALQSRVARAVPADRGFRVAAERYVREMQAATRIFDASTVDYVQEMIRDSHDARPQTVAELLAFMRKYRLVFASAEGRPRDGESYRKLYNLLRAQKDKLGKRPDEHPSFLDDP